MRVATRAPLEVMILGYVKIGARHNTTHDRIGYYIRNLLHLLETTTGRAATRRTATAAIGNEMRRDESARQPQLEQRSSPVANFKP